MASFAVEMFRHARVCSLWSSRGNAILTSIVYPNSKMKLQKRIASALNRPLRPPAAARRPRYSTCGSPGLCGIRARLPAELLRRPGATRRSGTAAEQRGDARPGFLARACDASAIGFRESSFREVRLDSRTWIGKGGVSLPPCAGSGSGFAGRARRQRLSSLGTFQKFPAPGSDCRTAAGARAAEQSASCLQSPGHDFGAHPALLDHAREMYVERASVRSEKRA